MADTPTPPAAPPALTALPNPVIPQQMAGIPSTQSAFDRHAESMKGVQAAPPSYSDEHAHQLEQARTADRAAQNAAAGLAARPPGEPAAPQAGAQGGEEPLLKPRNPRAATVRRANDWEAIKAERDQYRQEAERLRGLTPTAATQGGDIDITKLPFEKLKAHPDVARYVQERDTFYEEVKGVRVEADPEFKAKWDARTNAVMNTVKRVAGKAADEVVAIMGDRDPDRRMAALAERIKDFGEGSKHQLIAAAASLTAMEIERDIDIATRKATWESSQSARRQQEQGQWQQKLASMNNEFDNVWAEACHPTSGIPFLLDDKVKAAVLPDARRVFTGESDPRSIAKASLQSALFPHIIKSNMAAWQEVERLQGALAQYTGTWPTDDGSQLGEQAGNAPAPVNPVTSYNYDPHFARSMEAARQQDVAGKSWGR